MYKDVTIHVHNPTQAEYDALPFAEEGTTDESLKWKAFGNVTVFQPRPDRARTTVSIEYTEYKGEGHRLTIDRKDQPGY